MRAFPEYSRRGDTWPLALRDAEFGSEDSGFVAMLRDLSKIRSIGQTAYRRFGRLGPRCYSGRTDKEFRLELITIDPSTMHKQPSFHQIQLPPPPPLVR